MLHISFTLSKKVADLEADKRLAIEVQNNMHVFQVSQV
jgi:hypothetical protein